jgi:hypothetical protein
MFRHCMHSLKRADDVHGSVKLPEKRRWDDRIPLSDPVISIVIRSRRKKLRSGQGRCLRRERGASSATQRGAS